MIIGFNFAYSPAQLNHSFLLLVGLLPLQVHHNLTKALIDRGSKEGLVNFSADVNIKRVELADVFHEAPSEVLRYLLDERKVGVLRKHCIHQYNNSSIDHKIIYWQHFLKGGNKVVDYLLEARTSSSPDPPYTLTLSSINKKDIESSLPGGSLERLEDALGSLMKHKDSHRATIFGELRISSFEHGQAALTFGGALEEEDVEDDAQGDSSTRSLESVKRTKTILKRTTQAVNRKLSDKSLVYSSFKDILMEAKKVRDSNKTVSASSPHSPANHHPISIFTSQI